ncbi:hypothetical protein J2R99_000663 [Rhodopseudomonas julia]|uniref:Uncharacterized protein n=1 Tax=Rhodopseudomonas julia TaxID=200617 RepID=A0ABU0C2S7_9BRAD|nr:hypothetical protein [Rhodopseudomonas julia]MDQ0324814.1 hypothetical protein [Rhodopseudomonas julia]
MSPIQSLSWRSAAATLVVSAGLCAASMAQAGPLLPAGDAALAQTTPIQVQAKKSPDELRRDKKAKQLNNTKNIHQKNAKPDLIQPKTKPAPSARKTHHKTPKYDRAHDGPRFREKRTSHPYFHDGFYYMTQWWKR